MARVDLRCAACGYFFFVTDAQLAKPEGARCPSCLAPVGVTGPAAGGPGPKPVRVLEARPDSGALKLKMWIGIGAGALVLGTVAAVFLLRDSTPPPAPIETSIRPRPAPAPAPIVKTKPAARPAEKTASAPPSEEAPAPGFAAPAPAPLPEVGAQPAPAALAPLPADLLKSLREDLLALKDWHQLLVVSGPEKSRLNALLAAGKGGAEDVEFLRGMVSGPRFNAVKEEAALIREGRARLETEALEGLPVDKVIMNDGRVLHGKLLEETDAVVKLERKVAGGLAAEMPLPRADVKDVQKGKGIGGEFKIRWETAKKGGPGALVGLLGWCKDNTLLLQASLAAYAILVDDPGRSEARQQAGLAADPVSRMLEAEKQGGFITYEGRRWVPSELRDKLLRNNYAVVDGQWQAPNPCLISVPGLFRYETQNEKPVQITGTIAQEESITYSVVQGQEKMDVNPLRRFYAAASMTVTGVRKNLPQTAEADQVAVEDQATPAAGAPMRGEVFITVPLKGPLLEASVMTSAEVKNGGTITVSLVLDGRRIPLYTCAAKEDKAHKLPAEVRGRTEIQLVAELNGKASYGKKSDVKRVKPVKRDSDRVLQRGLDVTYRQLLPEYPALLFPSNAHTLEVFRLTGSTGVPAPALDKLFENARDILKK